MAQVLLVTPHMPPQTCGVGDFSALLSAGLRARGHSIHTVTGGTPTPSDAPSGIRRVPDWSRAMVERIVRQAAEGDYSHVLLQYAPSAYSPKGALPPIVRLPRLVRQAAPDCAVVTTFHEIFYITLLREWRRIPRNMTVGVGQRLSLLPLLRHSTACIATTDQRARTLSRLGRRLGRTDDVLVLPIGTNIEAVPAAAAETVRLKRRLGLADGLTLGTFSAAWEPEFVFGALSAARRAGLPARLLAVGLSEDRLEAMLPARFAFLREYVVPTGRLSADDVSRHLHALDLYLLPLIDGVSSRRTTLLAALSHGLPIVGTAGRTTDLWMRGSSALRLSEMGAWGGADAFARLVVETARDAGTCAALGAASRALFAERYTWERILDGYEDLLSQTGAAHSDALSALEWAEVARR